MAGHNSSSSVANSGGGGRRRLVRWSVAEVLEVGASSISGGGGGGGGSGFVWTAEYATSVPSAYSVGSQYYLVDAGTYGSGETGFVSNPNTDGNGYARITILEGTKDTTAWINIEEQIENGTLTGTFDYNNYTITEIKQCYHNYGEWTVTTAATCIATGIETRTCSLCGNEETQTVPISATGHSYGSWTVITAATCTTSGSQERTCSLCGNKETQTIAATGHSYSSWTTTTAATCTSSGSRYRTCSGCGNKETQTIAATGHSYGSWTVTTTATCTTTGSRYKTCSGCGDKQTETYSASGHYMENYYWSSDFDSSGSCTGCGTMTYVREYGFTCKTCNKNKNVKYCSYCDPDYTTSSTIWVEL